MEANPLEHWSSEEERQRVRKNLPYQERPEISLAQTMEQRLSTMNEFVAGGRRDLPHPPCDCFGDAMENDAAVLLTGLGLLGLVVLAPPHTAAALSALAPPEIGRASCRERV
eukprot:TRINITY_DN14623_c0_g1_i2.p1 TRINITY_DN14623_c0_g1~~TRINITY_DN14623_c0_g1_i2.p1  ORF type:complete len:112 (-),score=38.30 TRINITY_DN14623_c0_g1_i2:32-367(-)